MGGRWSCARSRGTAARLIGLTNSAVKVGIARIRTSQPVGQHNRGRQMGSAPEPHDSILDFVNVVREVRSLAKLPQIELSAAVRGDPAHCILARAMDCLVDNVLMHFQTSAEADAVASATEMARVGRLCVQLPRRVAAVGIAFDGGLLGADVSVDDWDLIRQDTFERLAPRVGEFTPSEMLGAVNDIRTLRGIEPLSELPLSGACKGGAHVLAEALGCVVYERNLVWLLAWVSMLFADEAEADLVASFLGEERYERDRSVSLPTPLASLYAAIELGTPEVTGYSGISNTTRIDHAREPSARDEDVPVTKVAA